MVNISGKVVGLACLLTFAVGGTAAYLGLSAAGLINKEGVSLEYTIDDKTYEYDGSSFEYTSDMVRLTSGELIEGHEAVFTFGDIPTDVGTYDISCGVKIIETSTKKDKTSNYKITVNSSEYSVTGRPVSIKLKDVSNYYSGNVVKFSEVEYKGSSLKLLSGDRFVVDDYNNAINCDDVVSASLIKVSVKDINNKDVTNNYALNIDYNIDNFEILQREITVTPNDVYTTYNGRTVSFNSYSISSGSLASNNNIEVSYSYDADTRINATSEGYSGKCTCYIYDQYGKDVSSNYLITTPNGHLYVEPKQVNVTCKEFSVDDGTSKVDLIEKAKSYLSFDGFLPDEGSVSITSLINSYKELSNVVTTEYDGTASGLYKLSFATAKGGNYIFVPTDSYVNVDGGLRAISIKIDNASYAEELFVGTQASLLSYSIISGEANLKQGHFIVLTYTWGDLTSNLGNTVSYYNVSATAEVYCGNPSDNDNKVTDEYYINVINGIITIIGD